MDKDLFLEKIKQIGQVPLELADLIWEEASDTAKIYPRLFAYIVSQKCLLPVE